jgi:hypothetical protein
MNYGNSILEPLSHSGRPKYEILEITAEVVFGCWVVGWWYLFVIPQPGVPLTASRSDAKASELERAGCDPGRAGVGF